MRLAEHLTALRALVQAMSAWLVNSNDVLRPGMVGIRGSMVIRLRPDAQTEYTLPPPQLFKPPAPPPRPLRLKISALPSPVIRNTGYTS